MFTNQRNKSLKYQSTKVFHPTQSSVAAGSAHNQGTLGIAIFGQTPRQKAQLHQAQPAMFAAQTRSLGGSSCLVGCNPGYVRGISWVNPLIIRLMAYLLSGMIHQKRSTSASIRNDEAGATDDWLTITASIGNPIEPAPSHDIFISDSSCSCTINNMVLNQSIWVKHGQTNTYGP